MRRSFFFAWIALTVVLARPLYARSVEAIEADLATFQIPAPEGERVLDRLELKGVTMGQFAEQMREYGVELLLAPGVSEQPVADIRIRNLSINRIVEIAIRSWGGHSLYDEGRLIVFASPGDLNQGFAERYALKTELQRELAAAKRERTEDETRSGRVAMGKIVLASFKVEEADAFSALRHLGRECKKVEAGRGLQIIPMFSPKARSATLSYHFEGDSVRAILDRICKDAGLKWEVSENRLIVTAAE